MILTITKLIKFSFVGKLHIGLGMVLVYSIFRFKPLELDGSSFITYLNKESVDVRDAAASIVCTSMMIANEL